MISDWRNKMTRKCVCVCHSDSKEQSQIIPLQQGADGLIVWVSVGVCKSVGGRGGPQGMLQFSCQQDG